MSYTALYRKYRPSTFDDVIGQQHIVQTLNNALARNRLAHAYLFSGPSGNGKTSIAKLFAKAINCTSETEVICDECENCITTKNNIHPDVIEIDAASNNGVDEIRSIIEKVKYAPLNGKYKIYIIDEVHMLSLGAFNALLKTLEEPPAHVIFVLATTEPHKVIPTIISRCQRYDFTRVSESDIQYNIEKILNNEQVEFEADAIKLISNLADGGVRESLSILEQTIAYSTDLITLDDVRRIYGIVTHEEKLALLHNIFDAKMESTLSQLNEISYQGNNLERLNVDLINILKESVIYSYAKSEKLLEILTVEQVNDIISKVKSHQMLEMVDILIEIDSAKKSIADMHSYIQLALIKMISIMSSDNNIEINKVKETRSTPEIKKVDIKTTSNINTSQHIEKNEIIKKPAVKEVLVEKAEMKPKTIVEPTVLNKEEPQVLHVETEVEVEVEVEPKISNDVSSNANNNEVVDVEINDEMLLSLLANANKDKRLEIESKWSQISNFITDIEFAKFAHKLKFSKLIAVGDNYALIVVENRLVADDINALDNQIGISEFIHSKLAEELRVFAISETSSAELINLFRQRAGQRTLPEPIVVTIPKRDQTSNKVTLKDKADSLFGVDGYTVEG